MTIHEMEVSRQELANLCRQFGTLLTAEVDLLRLLIVLRKQTPNPRLKEILMEVERDSRLGKTLVESLSRFPMVFSPFLLSMIRQGEEKDVLDQVLFKLADHLEREEEIAFTMPGSDRVPVRPSMDLAVEKLRPLTVGLCFAVAIIALAIAGLWYATNADWVSRQSLGPNVLLLIGILVLGMTLIFSRYRPPQVACCSFCGRSEQQAQTLLPGEGVWICDNCLERNVQILKEQQRSQLSSEIEEPVDKVEEEIEKAIVSHDIRVIRDEDLED